MDWCVQPFANANHAPLAVCNGDESREILRLSAEGGASVNVSAIGSTDPDGNSLSYRWFQYSEAGTYPNVVSIAGGTTASASFVAPSITSEQTIHIILEVTDSGAPALTSYRRVIVTVQPSMPGGGGGPDPSLIGHWKLDDGSGTTAVDSTATPANGTLTNGPAWIDGKIEGALEFDGTNDHVAIGNPTKLQLTGAMSAAAWIYIDSFTNSGRIISKQGSSGARGWSMNVESAGSTGAFQVASNNSTLITVTTADALPVGQWLHLAGVYEPGSAMRIYVNGELNNSLTTGVPATQVNSNRNVHIGARPTTNASPDLNFDGRIDDVRVYSRVLSALEIGELAIPPQSYNSWKNLNFSPQQLIEDPTIADFDRDADGDGRANGLEYADDTDPNAPDLPASPPQLAMEGGRLTLTYTRLKWKTGATLTPEVSGTLAAPWLSGPANVGEQLLAEDAASRSIKATDLAAPVDATAWFMRLKSTPNP